MDIALLKVDAGRPLPAIAWASADLMVGEDVITIGNAFGYENTAARDHQRAEPQCDALRRAGLSNLIQTDADQPGQLGRAAGEYRRRADRHQRRGAGAQGDRLALPIDDVKRVAVEMISTRRLAATWHGLAWARASKRGAIAWWSSRPCRRAARPRPPGSAGGGSSGRSAAWRSPRRRYRAGPARRPARPEGRRGGRPGRRGEGAGPGGSAPAPGPRRDGRRPRDQIWRQLGLKTTPVPASMSRPSRTSSAAGLYVQSVLPGGPADRASIQKGNILVGLNDGYRKWETIRPDNVVYPRPARVAPRGTPPVLLVRNNGFVEGACPSRARGRAPLRPASGRRRPMS